MHPTDQDEPAKALVTVEPIRPFYLSEQYCRLTLPSSGHSTAGFAVCGAPLMSNVKGQMTPQQLFGAGVRLFALIR